ncbi:TetR/AcrR family transcriptional regulator [Dietzia sp. B19]|uniref:TetR family transcriptional regulator C-terminal domain-containing protein n=1 Tax=Dietzia sp. B19 TaxID=1630632 RepID=UPI0019D5AA13
MIDEIAAHGLQAVTLARISARTGLAIGSIRHYFGNNVREVMRFTLSVLIHRAEHRVPILSGEPAARIVDAITFTAPTSEQEHRENIALVEYRVMGRADTEMGAEIAASSTAASTAIESLLRAALSDRAIDEQALQREALAIIALVEGFSLSSALASAPLRAADVRAVAEATVQRIRDAYPPLPKEHGI